MASLLEESLLAGALGFTTSRTTKHRARDGRLTPSLSAREPELFAAARVSLERSYPAVKAVVLFNQPHDDTLGGGDDAEDRRCVDAAGRGEPARKGSCHQLPASEATPALRRQLQPPAATASPNMAREAMPDSDSLPRANVTD